VVADLHADNGLTVIDPHGSSARLPGRRPARLAFRRIAPMRWSILTPRRLKLQKAQQLLHELESTSCVHGAFIIIRRIVEHRELLRSIMAEGSELLP
jgi:hypothetical protein